MGDASVDDSSICIALVLMIVVVGLGALNWG